MVGEESWREGVQRDGGRGVLVGREKGCKEGKLAGGGLGGSCLDAEVLLRGEEVKEGLAYAMAVPHTLVLPPTNCQSIACVIDGSLDFADNQSSTCTAYN